MTGLVRRWLGWWRLECVDLPSPLSTVELAVRMDDQLVSPWSLSGREPALRAWIRRVLK